VLPSLSEQRAIVAALLDAEADVSTLRRRLGKAREMKQGMMQELLTGHIRLPVTEETA
jgi:type I restriction enzyme S subunit